MDKLERIHHKYITVQNKLYLEINNWKIGSCLLVHLNAQEDD